MEGELSIEHVLNEITELKEPDSVVAGAEKGL